MGGVVSLLCRSRSVLCQRRQRFILPVESCHCMGVVRRQVRKLDSPMCECGGLGSKLFIMHHVSFMLVFRFCGFNPSWHQVRDVRCPAVPGNLGTHRPTTDIRHCCSCATRNVVCEIPTHDIIIFQQHLQTGALFTRAMLTGILCERASIS